MKDIFIFIAQIALAFFLVFLIFAYGMDDGAEVCNINWQRSAISHNAAHHDRLTGRFTWNDEANNETK